MASNSSVRLLDVLRETGLLTEGQLAQVPQLCQVRNVDAQRLSRDLVKLGWLTIYQTNELLAGNAKDLVLGPYHILDRLGQGAQSEVFKARHADSQWVVALKVIRKERLEQRGTTGRFLQEMEAMAQLDHPNIVQFLDADQVGDRLYCAMEFVEGNDLDKCVRLQGPLPIAEACDYVRQAAFGLQHAHEHNLVHRDIKPANLFLLSGQEAAAASVGGRGKIKILDWGLAGLKPSSERNQQPAPLKPTLTVTGTADYLAPEQAQDLQAADIRSDIYSLGCTLYYLLTGQPPFPHGNLAQKVVQHQQAEPTPLAELNPVVTDDLSAIVLRMMAKMPADRFQTPAAVALTLSPISRNQPVLANRGHG